MTTPTKPPSHVALFTYLRDHATNRVHPHATSRELNARTGLSQDAILNALARLTEEGAIDRLPSGTGWRIVTDEVDGRRWQKLAWDRQDPATQAKVRAFWAEGLSTAEIGRRMNVSKNAIIGMAHMLNLPSRGSPIGRTAGPRPARPALPPLASARRVQNTGTLPARAGTLPALARPVAVPTPRISAPMPPAPERVALPLTAKCRFPLWGDREKPTHKYCDAPAPAGGSWCDKCWERVAA